MMTPPMWNKTPQPPQSIKNHDVFLKVYVANKTMYMDQTYLLIQSMCICEIDRKFIDVEPVHERHSRR